ncbi:transcriptional regulator family: Fungal Specific TF [Penicillium rubens]|uniref:transcriptional regulator family: Fungal Specific TF n=1 Tax=Penicillium rubens TaxID=1108849 RepID=UPI002A598AD3|nr:transcriptional regulator family: Fungal Specific TF [Penicillium rubens]KAJ5840396.1 transcriptional regulator family: Fungal Specific TF [Penicillium rubens]
MMHSNHDPQARPGDLPRKKIRKGTRSCWQCKHRKVRCIFTSDSDQNCKECLARGIPCRSQELPEPENPRESDRAYVNERMARTENLLEKLLIRVDSGNHQWHGLKSPMDTAETSPESNPPTVTPASDNAPVLSLFDNGPSSETVEPDFTPHGTINRDWGELRRDLIALIPTQKTLKVISEASSSWWLMCVQLFEDYDKSLLSSSEGELSTSHPTVVGKAILWIALCLQQLLSEFDLSSLDLPCLPWVLVFHARLL